MPNYPTVPDVMDTRYAAPDQAIGEYTSGGITVRGYAMPSPDEENGYMDSPSGGWAAKLIQFPGGTPDPMRTQQLQQRDYRPTPLTDPPEQWWLRPGFGPGYEEQRDHTAQESVDADGWALTRGSPETKRAAPDIKRTPPPENRVTQQMSPANYSFTRPFDQRVAHMFNSVHFSMAAHRRDYAPTGMNTSPTRRNTYRIDPAPWDTDIVDMGNPAASGLPNARLAQIDVPFYAGNSYRLGG